MISGFAQVDENPYEVIGIPFSATDNDIRKAYRVACLRAHPDAGGGKDGVDFLRVKTAYEILKDPKRRAEWRQREPGRPVHVDDDQTDSDDAPEADKSYDADETPNRPWDRQDGNSPEKPPRRSDEEADQQGSAKPQWQAPWEPAETRKESLQTAADETPSAAGCLGFLFLTTSLALSVFVGTRVGEGGYLVAGAACSILIFGLSIFIWVVVKLAVWGEVKQTRRDSTRTRTSANPPPAPDRDWFRTASTFSDSRSSGSERSNAQRRSEELEDQLIVMIEQGNKLKAVRIAQKLYGMGIKDAKKFVEELMG